MDEWAGCGGFRRLKRIERTGARQGCAGKVEGFEGRIGVDTGGDLAQERRAAKRGKKPTSRPRRGSGAVAGGRSGGGRGHFVKRQIRAFARGANVRFTLDFTG